MRFLRKFIPRKQIEIKPEPIVKIPHIKSYDVLVTPQTYLIKDLFWHVERVIIDLRYDSVAESFLNFGVDAALTDGILIKYDGVVLVDIKSTADFGTYAYDVADLEDDVVTKFHTIHSRLSFFKFSDGIDTRHRHQLELIIQEDLSGSSNASCLFTFEGWRR